jgi:hypothetical protein
MMESAAAHGKVMLRNLQSLATFTYSLVNSTVV